MLELGRHFRHRWNGRCRRHGRNSRHRRHRRYGRSLRQRILLRCGVLRRGVLLRGVILRCRSCVRIGRSRWCRVRRGRCRSRRIGRQRDVAVRGGLRRIRVCRSLARGGSPCVGSRRSVETRAFRIGIAGHQHKVEHTAGNEGQHAEDQQDNAADADAVARLQRPERKTAADDEDQTDGEEDSGGRLYRVDDGQHGATHVDVMQTTYAKSDGRHKHDESPNGGERVSDGGDHAGIGEVPQRAEHESQHESDDGIGEEPPPELATRGAALEHRVLLEETDDRLAQVAAICGHVKRRGQCEEAIARLRLRCRLPVIRGWSLAVLRGLSILRGLSVLRSLVVLRLRCLAVLRSLTILRCLVVVRGGVLGRLRLPVIRRAVLRCRLRHLRIVLVGVRH